MDYDKLLEEHGSKAALARHLGIPRSTLRDRIDAGKRTKALEGIGLKEKDAEAAVMDKLDVTGTSRYYSLEDGGVWIKTSKEKQTLGEQIEAMKDGLSLDLPKVTAIQPPEVYNEDLCAVIPVGDAHIGMYAWHQESGQDFDLEIAVKDLCGAHKYLIEQGPAAGKCILINVGDFFHYHSNEGVTQKSRHVVSASGRPQAMLKAGVRAMRFNIEEAAKKHKTVEVINIQGNHDELLSHALNIMLEEIYADCPNIIIHSEPTTRHYTTHGNCLFGVVHGHQTKDRELPIIMAQERAEDWGSTRHRHWFRGHHHHDSRIEYTGTIVEQVRTLAPNDDYATGGGYLSGQDLKQIIFHKEYGEVGRTTCNVDMLRSMNIDGTPPDIGKLIKR